jgi:hypothetical protein
MKNYWQIKECFNDFKVLSESLKYRDYVLGIKNDKNCTQIIQKRLVLSSVYLCLQYENVRNGLSERKFENDGRFVLVFPSNCHLSTWANIRTHT